MGIQAEIQKEGSVKRASPAAVRALRALRDCGVIRTRFDHLGMIELHEMGIATATPVDDDEDALDYRLAVAT